MPVRDFKEGLERQPSIHDCHAGLLKAPYGTSPSAPELLSHPLWPLPALFQNLRLKFLTPSAGQCNSLSHLLASALTSSLLPFSPGQLIKVFLNRLPSLRGILVSAAALSVYLLQVVTLSCISLPVPPVFSQIPHLSPLQMPNLHMSSSALCPPLSLPCP